VTNSGRLGDRQLCQCAGTHASLIERTARRDGPAPSAVVTSGWHSFRLVAVQRHVARPFGVDPFGGGACMSDTGQLTSSAAEVYDEFYLPALFEEWPARLVAAADLEPGSRVLDVACGTGVLTIAAAKAVSPDGSAVGLDLNAGMLAVAGRKAPEIEWREAPAEALPFDAEEFDAVVSQFGLMFFEDQRAAIREMWRVLRPGGRLALAVWDSLDNNPGYRAVTTLLARLFGDDVAELLRAPYALGDTRLIETLLTDSGVADPRVTRVPGVARFSSIQAWMQTDVRGWTLSDQLDDAQFEELAREAEIELRDFVTHENSVRFDNPALIATACKP
jgi:SAM-dependent methyltransferase